jgi:hypothetical protein
MAQPLGKGAARILAGGESFVGGGLHEGSRVGMTEGWLAKINDTCDPGDAGIITTDRVLPMGRITHHAYAISVVQDAFEKAFQAIRLTIDGC